MTDDAIAEIRAALGTLLINSEHVVIDGEKVLITKDDHLAVVGEVYKKHLMKWRRGER